MKRVLAIAASCMIGMALVGCHAEADVDHPDTDHGGSSHYEKKTTTYDNGDRTVKTETKTENR